MKSPPMDIGKRNFVESAIPLNSRKSDFDDKNRWIDYHSLGPEREKAYIQQQMDCLHRLTGKYPVGWYVGRLSPYSQALVHEVHEELKTPLLWFADTYADDLPYWVDVPAERDSPSPKGMLMLPYR